MQESEAGSCHICAQGLVAEDTASCHLCYKDFHLAMTIQSQTKDCGQIFMNNDTLALAFVCNQCLSQVEANWSPVG